MPPQPLSSTASKGTLRISPGAFDLRPNLAVLVAKIIASWSEAEARLANVLVTMLGAHADPAIAMFQALSSTNAQTDAIDAAAREVLAEEQFERFDAIMAIFRRARKKRNRLAHHTWATIDDLPDALALIDPAGRVQSALTINKLIRGVYKEEDPMRRAQDVVFARDRIFIYREQDFQEILDETTRVTKYLGWFDLYISPYPTPAPVAATLQQLWNEPDLQEQMARQRRGKTLPE